MNITVIGASAGVGLETVKLALQRNHKVTTLSRSKIDINNANLTTIIGSALVKEDVEKSIQNADALIVALGTGTSIKATTLYSTFAKILLALNKEQNLQMPIIILTGFGAGDSINYYPWYMRIVFNLLLSKVYADKTIMENMLTPTAMKWIIARPGILNNKPLTQNYRVETTLSKGIKMGSISRMDVADFMIKQAENPTHIHQYCSLFNK